MADMTADLIARLQHGGVQWLDIAFLDYNGIPRARAIAAENAESAFGRGVNFSSPTVDFNSRDLFPPGAAFDLSSPDVWARADPRGYRQLKGSPGRALVLADLVDAAGDPWIGCPRSALKRQIEVAAGRNLSFNVGFEPEGYLFRSEGAKVTFAGPAYFAGLDGLDLFPEFMEALLAELAGAGLTVDQWSEEYGPGQVEVNLRYAPALDAADNLVTFRHIFRDVAHRYGLLGTFMPKPFEGQVGSGLHVHLSAVSPNGGPNLFDDPADRYGLSATARYALAGLLRHAPALLALGASTVNSYKRFLPGSWAPTHVTWGYASRAAFIRVPERETPRRLEIRSGDGAGNPYLYLTGILAAMLDGITRGQEPSDQQVGDVGALSPSGAAKRGIAPLPRTLDEALNALAADPVIRDALGPVIPEEYIKVKRSEWEAFCLHVGEWDRAWYLRRY
ncbi:MAG TPA: glutamine synthetase family protein [Chloroflexota bacterium]|nr:glutamine synthetase family protein [Chloroflexota bacterium]